MLTVKKALKHLILEVKSSNFFSFSGDVLMYVDGTIVYTCPSCAPAGGISPLTHMNVGSIQLSRLDDWLAGFNIWLRPLNKSEVQDAMLKSLFQ